MIPVRSQWGHSEVTIYIIYPEIISSIWTNSHRKGVHLNHNRWFFPTPNREANARFGYTPLQPLQIFEFRILLHHRRTFFWFSPGSRTRAMLASQRSQGSQITSRSTLIWCLTFSRYWCVASWHKQDNAFRFTHFPGSLWIANLLHVVGYWYSTWDKPIWDDFP